MLIARVGGSLGRNGQEHIVGMKLALWIPLALLEHSKMASLLDQALGPLSDALELSGYRQQLLAANIANANTPNYKAVDIPFAQTLHAMQSGAGASLSLRTNQSRQLPESPRALDLAAQVQFQRGNTVGLDGNSVNMEQEQSDFLQNSIRYQADVTFLTGKIKTLLSAITGTTQ